jgi:ribosome recycling factor
MVTEYRTPTAIVRVHRPELTDDQRKAQMKKIEKAAVNLLLAAAEQRKEN